MALLLGELTLPQTIASGQGTLEITQNAANGGHVERINLNTLKGGTNVTIGGAGSTVASARLLGNSYAITGAVTTPATVFVFDNHNFVGGQHTILGGEGKARIYKAGSPVDITGQEDFVTIHLGNIPQAGIVIDAADSDFILEQGATAITQEGGTAQDIAFGGTAVTGETITFGQGLAVLANLNTSGGNENERLVATEDRQEEFRLSQRLDTLAGATVTLQGTGVVAAANYELSDTGELVFATAYAQANIVRGSVILVTFEGSSDNFEKVIKLDQAGYPFTLTANETLTPIGASFVVYNE